LSFSWAGRIAGCEFPSPLFHLFLDPVTVLSPLLFSEDTRRSPFLFPRVIFPLLPDWGQVLEFDQSLQRKAFCFSMAPYFCLFSVKEDSVNGNASLFLCFCGEVPSSLFDASYPQFPSPSFYLRMRKRVYSMERFPLLPDFSPIHTMYILFVSKD